MNIINPSAKPVWLYARVLCAVAQTGSITLAAQRLDVTPSAISNVLAKLRLDYNDALFVRVRGQMAVTPKAQALIKKIAPLVEQLENAFTDDEGFDPSTTKRHFYLASPDYFDSQFLPTLIDKFTQFAPSAKLTISPLLRSMDTAELLEDGHLDLVISNWQDDSAALRRQRLIDDEIVCLVRTNHPLVKKQLSLENYLSARHIAPTPMGPSKDGIIDAYLLQQGYKREIAVFMPYFNLIPEVLKQSDLILTTSRGFCERVLSSSANSKALTIVACPIKMPAMRFYQAWHARQHDDAGHAWLRDWVKKTVLAITEK